ncbi:MAG: hypothetical protein KGH98_02645 [Candidatus Micrarchaeota archaeon]|nr:hypothetical protein [Candidatus Micrarchaeota archaeon]
MGIGSSFYRHVVKPYYFSKDPEEAHESAKRFLRNEYPAKLMSGYFDYGKDRLSVNLGGTVKLDGPVGLAAGFDKNGEMLNGLGSIMDYITVGTMLPYRWEGNPKTKQVLQTTVGFSGSEWAGNRQLNVEINKIETGSRVVRMEKERAINNCLGFPFAGPEVAFQNLERYSYRVPLNASIAVRPTDDPLHAQERDQLTALIGTLSYFVGTSIRMVEVNFASPNTKGLAVFFNGDVFDDMARCVLDNPGLDGCLFFLKMPPHTDEQTRERNLRVAARWMELGGDGITAINTLRTEDQRLSMGVGGKSGKPIYPILKGNLKDYNDNIGNRKPIINAAGGIWPENVPELMIEHRVNTVQLFTSIMYEGFAVVRDAKAALLRAMDSYGIDRLEQIRR